MKWFKHDSNAHSDAKLLKLRLKYGMEGCGLYWHCLELIAASVEAHNISFELEHDAEIIAANTGINTESVEEMLGYMVELGLFKLNNEKKTICTKMATRTDEYTQKIFRQQKHNASNNHSPDSVGTKSDLIEENIKEKNKKEKNKLENTRVENNIHNSSISSDKFDDDIPF